MERALLTNAEIARIFTEIGEILDYLGEDPFRVRAYFTAARSIELYPESVAEIATRDGEKGLREIPGIGEATAAKILELTRTGHLRAHDRLVQRVPKVVLALERIPGVGPKTAKELYVRLKPKDVNDLRAKLETIGRSRPGQPPPRIQHPPRRRLVGNERVPGTRQLRGIGPKTVAKILEGIQLRQKLDERTPLGEALPVADALLSRLVEDSRVIRADLAGSIRRHREDVGDVDLVAATNAPLAVIDRFVRSPGVTKVVAQGRSKATVVLRDRITADLELLPREAYGSLLQHLTGSKDHNVAFRLLAERNGLSFSEHGFRVTNARRPVAARAVNQARRERRYEVEGRLIRCRTEEQVYATLGLDWIPPELRENQGELEAAANHTLPDLIEARQIRGDLHVHSNQSRDGHDSVEAIIERAIELKHDYVAITDHTAGVGVAGKLSDREFLTHAEQLHRLNERYGEIEVIAGCELNIKPDGSLDASQTLLEALDIVVASVHSSFDQRKAPMTERIIRALEHPAVTILAHPTTRRLGERGQIDADWTAIFAAAARADVALEINASLDRLDLESGKIRTAKQAGCRFAINSDAHRASELGSVRYGVAIARRGWLEKTDVVNALPRPKFLAWLKKT